MGTVTERKLKINPNRKDGVIRFGWARDLVSDLLTRRSHLKSVEDIALKLGCKKSNLEKLMNIHFTRDTGEMRELRNKLFSLWTCERFYSDRKMR